MLMMSSQKGKSRQKSHSQHPQKIEWLGINLNKEVKDLYDENYQTLMKKSSRTQKWKDVPCSWIRRNTIKMSTLPKAISKFN